MEIGQAVSPGWIVYGADGEPLGTVESSDDSYVVVEAEDVPTTFSIPVSAIVETREDGVYLSVTRDDALNQGWDQEPMEGPDRVVDSDAGYSAIQGEDSLDEEYETMPAPAEDIAVSSRRPAGLQDEINRPSGETGPDTSGSR